MPSIISASTASNTALNLSADTSGVLEIRTGSSPTTAMTIDGSQNVGIGTSSPSRRLTILDTQNNGTGISINNNSSGAAAQSTLAVANGTNSGAFGIVGTGFTTYGSIAAGNTFAYAGGSQDLALVSDGGNIKFGTGSSGTERMRIDSSGNVGIGVTPSAWAASSQAIQNVSGCIWRFGATNMYIGANYYYNGSNRLYVVNGAASEYNQNGTTHNFYSSTSGTAGGTVSMTQVLQVGLGTTVSLQGASTNISGTGISFPATQFPSSNANTLDDYEEGTFTLVFADNTSGGNTKNVSASYTKIGNIVKIRFSAYYEALPTFTAGNQIYIRNLPFSTVGEGCAGSIMLQNSYGTSIPIYAWQPSGQTWFVIKLNDFVTGVLGSNLNGFALTTYGNLIYFTNT